MLCNRSAAFWKSFKKQQKTRLNLQNNNRQSFYFRKLIYHFAYDYSIARHYIQFDYAKKIKFYAQFDSAWPNIHHRLFIGSEKLCVTSISCLIVPYIDHIYISGLTYEPPIEREMQRETLSALIQPVEHKKLSLSRSTTMDDVGTNICCSAKRIS